MMLHEDDTQFFSDPHGKLLVYVLPVIVSYSVFIGYGSLVIISTRLVKMIAS